MYVYIYIYIYIYIYFKSDADNQVCCEDNLCTSKAKEGNEIKKDDMKSKFTK